MYRFKKNFHVPNLINIYKQDDIPLCIDIYTTLRSNILIENEKHHYVIIDVNDELNNIMMDIQSQAEDYLKNNELIEEKVFKSNYEKDTMNIKIPRAYKRYKTEFFDHDNNRTVSSELKQNRKVNMCIVLEYVWLSHTTWGFTWKASHVKVL